MRPPDITDLTRHHIHRLTRLAAVLDARGRHADADRLDRIVRQAQWWNPVRSLKNWQNANEVNGNQGDPADILHLMQLNLDKLCRNSQEEGEFVGLDPSVRPSVIKLVSECSKMLREYTNAFNQQPSPAPTSARSTLPVRKADLAGGLDRDIADVLGLLSNLQDTQMFPRGDALYAALQVRLKAVDDLLLGNITPQQASAQVGDVSEASASVDTGVAPATFVDQIGPQPPTWSTGGQASPTAPRGLYSFPGEAYNSPQYQQQERVPGSPEWANEVNNYVAWGLKNGGLNTLTVKLQQDRHTPQFQQAVQQAWHAKVLLSAPTLNGGGVGTISSEESLPPQMLTLSD